jgi:hypothetical protein
LRCECGAPAAPRESGWIPDSPRWATGSASRCLGG